LNIDDEEIAWDNPTQQSLSLHKRNTPKYTGAAFTAPDLKDPTKTRPTELEVSNRNVKSKLQYCTAKTMNVAFLRAAVGDLNYKCEDAVVFVRFIYTEPVDTSSQTVKIGLYSKSDLAHVGWLQQKEKGELSIVSTYESATKYTLKRDPGMDPGTIGPFKVGNLSPRPL
jgi:hypothetical protein